MTKNVLITPAAADIIKTPDGTPAECRLVISADDEDVTLNEAGPVAVTGDTDKFTVTPDGNARILKKSVPSIPGALYYLHPDGSVTTDPSGSVSLIAKGVDGGSYRAQTGEYAPGRKLIGGSLQPVHYTTQLYSMCVDALTGNLYVFGVFSSISGVAAAGVAMWNGEAWSEVGGGITLSSNPTTMRSASHPSGGFVLHCQHLTQAGAVPVTPHGTVRWTGSEWIDLCSPSATTYVSISDSGDIYIGEYVYTEGKWSRIAQVGVTGTVYGRCSMPDTETDLFYGDILSIDYFPTTRTAEKIGNVFENTYPMPSPSSYPPHTILRTPDNMIYSAPVVPNVYTTYKVSYWNGSAWAYVPGFPFIKGYVNSFIVDSTTGKMALSGSFYLHGGTVYPGGLIQGSGASWTYSPMADTNVSVVSGIIPGQAFLIESREVYEFSIGEPWS